MKKMLKELTVKNQRVLDLFRETEQYDLGVGQTLRHRNCTEENYLECGERATSEQYLKDMIAAQDPGHITHGVNFIFGETPGAEHFLKNFKEVVNFDQYYTSGYVPHGFVGWHSDGDTGGWYLMVTYCTGDQGFFRYYDRDNDSIVTLEDQPGWAVRTVELKKDYDNMFWHCALSHQPRYTFLLLFNDYDKFLVAQEAVVNL